MFKKRKTYEQILDGAIHIERNFLDEDFYNETFERFKKLKYNAYYQPYKNYYGNRFQGSPVHEVFLKDEKFNQIIINKIEHLIECKIKDVLLKVRKVNSEEIAKSKFNNKYGPIHTDVETTLAAILPFFQSASGGTAFFEHLVDQYPDITIGAYPNRLIIFNGNRPHAPCNDLTYDETYKLNIFFNLCS
jgi:hypothetical protein